MRTALEQFRDAVAAYFSDPALTGIPAAILRSSAVSIRYEDGEQRHYRPSYNAIIAAAKAANDAGYSVSALERVIDEVFGVVSEATAAPTKAVNPKDAMAFGKVAYSTFPRNVAAEAALGMMEGDRKYGGHNYREAGALASVQFNAALRHLDSWWEGEDIDPLSGVHHVAKAISALAVLRDTQMRGICEDDRPPASPPGWLDKLNAQAAAIIKKFPNRVAPFLARNNQGRIHAA